MKASKGMAARVCGVLLCCSAALLLMISGCQQRLPTEPPSRNLTTVGTAQGIMCNQSVVFQQDIYHDPKTKEFVTVFRFADLQGTVFGKAELTTAADLVTLINSKTYNIPGQTTLKVGAYFTIKVTITTPSARPNYYQIDVQHVGNGDQVTFFIPKTTTRLAKSSDTETTEEINAPPPLLVPGLCGHVVLLCLGSCETMMESRDCLLNSPAYCSRRGVSDAYIEGSMSLKSGCTKSCRVICKSHDQGKIGR